MAKKRALIAYCVDVDACAPWFCNTGNGKPTDATSISRGIFGANVGLDRLLKFFKKHGIAGTFNIPSHAIESFPEQMRKIVEAGHEIGLHGYTHEPPSLLTEEQERTVLKKSIEVYEKFTGSFPKGFIAPNWEASSRTIRLLEEAGITYDHSLMAHDCQPHWAADCVDNGTTVDFSTHADTWMKPMQMLRPRNVVEIPGNWDLTDFSAFNFVPAVPNSHGYVDPHVVERNWREMFEGWWAEYNEEPGVEPRGFVFSVTIHPQSSGKPHVLAMHERFVTWLKGFDGVEFVTCARVADEFLKGTLKGAEVSGGI